MVELPKNLEQHSFPVKVIRVFTVPLLNTISKSFIQRVMKKTNKDASTVVSKGGTTHALEAMYGRGQRKLFSRGLLQGFSDSFWHHVVSQPKALRNRLKIVQSILQGKILEKIKQNKNNEISVLSIAGGSARSLIYTLKNLKDLGFGSNISVITVDKDALALKVGEKIAAEYGIGQSFKWINSTASEVTNLFPNKKFDCIEIVGLLDYFNFDRAKKLSSLSHNLLREGGFIVIANVIPNSEQSFVEKTGWPAMYYRNDKEIRALLQESGFMNESIEVITEPLNIHMVALAYK